jgi:hypothetical protein
VYYYRLQIAGRKSIGKSATLKRAVGPDPTGIGIICVGGRVIIVVGVTQLETCSVGAELCAQLGGMPNRLPDVLSTVIFPLKQHGGIRSNAPARECSSGQQPAAAGIRGKRLPEGKRADRLRLAQAVHYGERLGGSLKHNYQIGA